MSENHFLTLASSVLKMLCFGCGLLILWFISSGKSHWMLANIWPFNNRLNKDNWTGTRRFIGAALWGDELSFANCWSSKILGSWLCLRDDARDSKLFWKGLWGTTHCFQVMSVLCSQGTPPTLVPALFTMRSWSAKDCYCQQLQEKQLDGPEVDGWLWLT